MTSIARLPEGVGGAQNGPYASFPSASTTRRLPTGTQTEPKRKFVVAVIDIEREGQHVVGIRRNVDSGSRGEAHFSVPVVQRQG
jgi:hypothetical protein